METLVWRPYYYNLVVKDHHNKDVHNKNNDNKDNQNKDNHKTESDKRQPFVQFRFYFLFVS